MFFIIQCKLKIWILVLIITFYIIKQPSRMALSVKCLATDASLTADPGVASSIPARSHTFVEIDYETISTVNESFPLIHSRRIVVSYKGKYVNEVLVNCLFKLAQEKSVVRWTDCPAMTIAVDWDVKQQNKQTKYYLKQIVHTILHPNQIVILIK